MKCKICNTELKKTNFKELSMMDIYLCDKCHQAYLFKDGKEFDPRELRKLSKDLLNEKEIDRCSLKAALQCLRNLKEEHAKGEMDTNTAFASCLCTITTYLCMTGCEEIVNEFDAIIALANE
jgi:hypothetical protein